MSKDGGDAQQVGGAVDVDERVEVRVVGDESVEGERSATDALEEKAGAALPSVEHSGGVGKASAAVLVPSRPSASTRRLKMLE